MADAKVLFLHGLHPKIVEAIVSFNPKGFRTVVLDGKSPEAEQIEAVKDADYIMNFRAKVTEPFLRAAKKAKLLQVLSAGYDRLDLKLLRELKKDRLANKVTVALSALATKATSRVVLSAAPAFAVRNNPTTTTVADTRCAYE